MNIRIGTEASTDSFWHDIAISKTIKPIEILESKKDVERVEGAIAVVDEFYQSCVQQIDGFLM